MLIGLGIGLPFASAISLAAQIAALFAAGEQGVLYDPADFSTMFQDAAGTTPVTTVGQPVGLALDKSKGLVLGPELVTNGDFSSGATGWTAGDAATTLSVANGVLRITNGDATGAYATQSTTVPVVGKTYKVTIQVVTKPASNAARFIFGGYDSGNTLNVGTTTTHVTATTTGGLIISNGNTGVNGEYAEYDNISVRELPGNHGKQATSTARPLRQASPTRIDYDGVDDTLVSTFATSLGAACTVCRAVPGVGASILTAQTIGTSYTDSTDHSGLIIVNRALTAAETASVTAYLNAKAFA